MASHRMTLSEVVERVTQRGSRPTVELTLNARGEVQFTVTCPADDLATASTESQTVFDALIDKYPRYPGSNGGS